MASIPTSFARQKAIDRIMAVLQAQYATEITATVSEFEQSSGQLTDLFIDPPTSDAYYYTPDQPDSDTAEPISQPVGVFFSPDSPRQLDAKGSQGNTGGIEQRTFSLACIIVVRKEPNEPITRNGKELSPNEILRLRTEIYTGALIECVQKYGCEPDHIHDLELVDDNSDLYFIDDALWGVGGAVFEVTQMTKTPRRQALP